MDPAQTGAFLDHAAGDPLYALYHLVVFTGLRRGEACGVHWDDLDLDGRSLAVRWQVVRHGGLPRSKPPTDDSQATIALDQETVRVLRTHRTHQHRQHLASGAVWTDSRLVFTTPDPRPPASRDGHS